jgi:hypothetical protein
MKALSERIVRSVPLLGAAMLVVSFAAHAQERKLTAQAERTKDCESRADDRLGDQKRDFMSRCLREAGASEANANDARMASCEQEAKAKKLRTEERRKFLLDCMKS